MKKAIFSALVLCLICSGTWGGLAASESVWPGIDESVVKKFAEQAGRPPREPYINTAQGDLQLFFFLLAGTVGGFIAGYNVRGLFPPRSGQPGQ